MTVMDTYEGHTAAEYRQMAADCDRRAQESWERSDTDGFLSQWASGITARKYLLCADLIAQGGTVTAPALFLLDGRVASLVQREGQYGPYWLLNDDAIKATGRRFYSHSKARKSARRRAFNRDKGFTLGSVAVAGKVDICGSGRGLSGAATAYAAILPDDDALRHGDVKIIATDDDTTDY